VLDTVQNWFSRDYFPVLWPYLRWMRQPLSWLAVAIIATFLFGLTIQPRVFWLSGCIACVTLLGLLWPGVTMRGVSCRISFSEPQTTEGDRLSVFVTLRNRWPWPLWGLTIVGGFHRVGERDDDDGLDIDAALAMVPAWSESVFCWDFTPSRRGVYPKNATFITSGFPFGLWQSRRVATIENRLIVWPCRFAIPSVLPDVGFDLNGLGLADTRPGDAGDFLGVRPYRNGDTLRRVHWPQTARHNRLIVCERQAATRPGVRIIADLRDNASDGVPFDDRLEQAIRTTASLCESLHQRHVRLEYCDAQILIRPTADRHGIEQILDHLATIPDRGLVAETPPEELQKQATPQIQGMLDIVITPERVVSRRPHFHTNRAVMRRVLLADNPQSVQNQWEAICRET